MDRALQHSGFCNQFLTLKAECLALMGRYQESQEIVKYVFFLYWCNIIKIKHVSGILANCMI